MGMFNNTKVRVNYPLEEILQIAFQSLARQGLVPYTNTSDYQSRYTLKNSEGKIITNVSEISVIFSLEPHKEVVEETLYETGSWKDPELVEGELLPKT